MVHLVLYSRPGCHLCELMRADLHQFLPPRAFDLQVVDVGEDPELFSRYGLRVPVLVDSEGVEICEHLLDREALAAQVGPY